MAFDWEEGKAWEPRTGGELYKEQAFLHNPSSSVQQVYPEH